ncbi:MAG TPA: glycosyltransferase family 2 protein [Gammaproteobacteria bacterium]|nr:glycosyltransferase family 2 protein [Gammaproteobacteria bacterium]
MAHVERSQLLQKKEVFISCIVPVYNEQANVSAFFPMLAETLKNLANRFEIIVIDDGSKDETVAKILQLPKGLNIKLLGFSRNFGKETALTAGLDNCSGDVAILMDADFQHPVEVLSQFLAEWAKGHEMVYGVRKNRDNEPRVKRNFARLFYWLMAKMTKIDMPNNAGDFRLLDKKVVGAINSFQERTRFMKGLYAWVGFKKIAVPYEVQERAGGRSSWGFFKLTELAITGITTFSDIPLRVWGFVGFIVSLVSLVYAIYFVTSTLIFGTDLPGFPSLIVAVMFLGGVQLFSIGILGEYIARIFTEVKKRPKYIIETQIGFDDTL